MIEVSKEEYFRFLMTTKKDVISSCIEYNKESKYQLWEDRERHTRIVTGRSKTEHGVYPFIKTYWLTEKAFQEQSLVKDKLKWN